jgi:hypothetical protein
MRLAAGPRAAPAMLAFAADAGPFAVLSSHDTGWRALG